MTANGWARRLLNLGPAVDAADTAAVAARQRDERAAVRLRAEKIPRYAGGALQELGKFGGDVEFVAAADLMGTVILSVHPGALRAGPEARHDAAWPGLRRDVRGNEHRGHNSLRSLCDVLHGCLREHRVLRVALSGGGGQQRLHWHALVPTDPTGRVVVKPLTPGVAGAWTAAARQVAAAEVAAYDAAGGFQA